MPKELNITGITVLKLNRKSKVSTLIEAALAQNASSVPELVGITHDDAAMHGFGTTLQSVYIDYKSSPPTATKEDVDIAKSNLVEAHGENANDIQSIARREAKLAGSVHIGINIVQKAGYKLKSPKSAMNKSFSAKSDGPGSILIRTKAIGPRAVYIREYAKTIAKNIVPHPDDIEDWIVSTENDVRLEGVDSMACYAIREACIQPIPRKPMSKPTTNVEEKATSPKITKGHRRTYQHQSISNYTFGPWIWVITQ